MKHTCGKDGDPGAVAPLDGICPACVNEAVRAWNPMAAVPGWGPISINQPPISTPPTEGTIPQQRELLALPATTKFTIDPAKNQMCVLMDDQTQAAVLNWFVEKIEHENQKWNFDLEGKPIQRDFFKMMMLLITELAEAVEGHRKDLMDDHLPNRKMTEVEMADALTRLLDLAAVLKLDLGGAFVEKIAYNRTREDHKIEARQAPNGKKY